MNSADLPTPGPSHGKPVVSKVTLSSEEFDSYLADMVSNVLDNPSSEPDPYDSDRDPDYQIDSPHDSESEQEAGDSEGNANFEEENLNEYIAQSPQQTNFFFGKKVGKREPFKWRKESPPVNSRLIGGGSVMDKQKDLFAQT
ncbi:hypothetical protein J6590_009810 [Homalodisca vitripennis]|nr:hypothetical protein J6590_009810 [Homalodisca vitripennis]